MKKRKLSKLISNSLHFSFILLFLLFSLCFISCEDFAANSIIDNTEEHSELPLEEYEIIKNEFIVTFYEYNDNNFNEEIIKQILSNYSTKFEILQRTSPFFSSLPSDFSLILIKDEEYEEELINELKNSEKIRLVASQRKFTSLYLKSFIEKNNINNNINKNDINKKVNNNNNLTKEEEEEILFKEFFHSDEIIDNKNKNKNNEDNTFNPFYDNPLFTSNFYSKTNTKKWREGKRAISPIEVNDEMKIRKLLNSNSPTPELINADFFWDKMHFGGGVKVAIFDTGVDPLHPHLPNLYEVINWTDENTLNDFIGHGTFVASIIGSSHEQCPGIAPEAELYIFRVFNSYQVSYTTWFLDAFNYAIHAKINILNLSIGGPDYKDYPFVDKINEMSANNIIIVSAIGNDGPFFGTLSNPADMNDVIGVGGIDNIEKISSFSSRGMTTWELPNGYGRIKPDILTYSNSILGLKSSAGCKVLSGTSVSSPIVSASLALLISVIPPPYRPYVVNAASIKQIIIESADKIENVSIFEQGFGKLNIVAAYDLLDDYTPHISTLPSSLDLTDCDYMWPLCSQPLYHRGMEVKVNVTILNSISVTSSISEPHFIPFYPNGDFIQVGFKYEEYMWPWTGNLGVIITIKEDAKNFKGIAEGMIEFSVISYPSYHHDYYNNNNNNNNDEGKKNDVIISKVQIGLRVEIIPTPPRNKRILFDQFHSLSYPSSFFPCDTLWDKGEPFDWNGDHLHTNFRGLYTNLRELGYYVEVLGLPYTCFDANEYGTLFLIDPEDDFSFSEIQKLQSDIKEKGLSLIAIGDWYNTKVFEEIKFLEETTQKWWLPVTGGANIPALNDLLHPFDIQFDDQIYYGPFSLGVFRAIYNGGVGIAKFPKGGLIFEPTGMKRISDQYIDKIDPPSVAFPAIGLTEVEGGGRIGVMGDSSCFDDIVSTAHCYWLLFDLLNYTMDGEISPLFQSSFHKLSEPYFSTLPKPLRPTSFSQESRTMNEENAKYYFSCPSVPVTPNFNITAAPSHFSDLLNSRKSSANAGMMMNDRGDQAIYSGYNMEDKAKTASLSSFPFYFHPTFVFLPIFVLLLISFFYFNGFRRKRTALNPT